jgi:hypothetical protein
MKGGQSAMKIPAILAAFVFATPSLGAQTISGDWHGSVQVANDAPLRLALHVANENAATLDSADEGVTALKVDSIGLNGETVQFEIRSISGRYQGALAPDGSRITGTWSQDGGVWPLNWERGEDPANVTKPVSVEEAMKKGRACTQSFYEGKLAGLWLSFSPVVQQAFMNKEQFAQFRQQTIRRLGSEKRVLSEGVTSAGEMRVYHRVAEFQRSEGSVTIELGFNSRGMIAVFAVDAGAVKGFH